jgi:NAD+ dependent glucose-6-phosphate dehydrogenase
MKRACVLITGATGRLGQLLLQHCANAFELRATCLNPASLPGVTAADLSLFEQCDQRLFAGVDVVVHCAARASPSASWAEVQRHNVDATFNVFEAAARAGVGRVVFMSSNWTMAGYRFGTEVLTEALPPRPTNPYGVSKVVGERIGRSFADHRGLSVICLRIGYCGGLAPQDPRLDKSSWVRQKWLGDRDFLQLVERSITATDIGFAIVNGMSNNAGMRWDLATGRRLLGYVPVEGLACAGRGPRLREFLKRYTRGAFRDRRWAGS